MRTDHKKVTINKVGQMLAGLLDWPQATFASKITLDEKAGKVYFERFYSVQSMFVMVVLYTI